MQTTHLRTKTDPYLILSIKSEFHMGICVLGKYFYQKNTNYKCSPLDKYKTGYLHLDSLLALN